MIYGINYNYKDGKIKQLHISTKKRTLLMI